MLTLLADLTPEGAVCLGVSAAGVVALPALLFADAHRADFDPRPAVHRAMSSPAADRVLVEVVRARYTLAARLDTVSRRLTSHAPNGAAR